MEKNTRRSFIKKSAAWVGSAGFASALPKIATASAVSLADRRNTSPADRVNIGVIGVGMGIADMRNMLKNNWVHCIALCDVDQVRLEKQATELKKDFPANAGSIKLYKDFRKLLEEKEVDGVIIATPDHWHTYIFAEACKAGKAIYVEKPVGNSIAECNALVKLQENYKNVVTTGLWQTSQKYFLAANEILKTGVLGDIYKVHIFLCQTTNPRVPEESEATIPSTLDYELWLGPAPQRPYSKERVRNWRSYWDYGGGQQTDWGVHWIDSAFDGLVALGKQRTFPESVFSIGYKHPKTSNETPSCQTSLFKYMDYHIVWEQQVSHLYNRNQGVAWIGNKGTLVCNRLGYELIPEKSSEGVPLAEATQMVGEYEEGGIYNHTTNWGECIRTNNKMTNSPIGKGAFATILAQMADISFRTGTTVQYEPNTRKFINNTAADALLKPVYRAPWIYPTV